MTFPEYDTTIKQLYNIKSKTKEDQVLILKSIKYNIIGSTIKKRHLSKLKLIPKLLSILSSKRFCSNVKTQAAIILGSLSLNQTTKNDIIQSNGLFVLFSLINLSVYDLELIEASLRALKSILCNETVKNFDITQNQTIKIINKLLEPEIKNIASPYRTSTNSSNDRCTMYTAELAASIVEKFSVSEATQMFMFENLVVDKLLNLLFSCFVKTQVASLKALANLTKNNKKVSGYIAKVKNENKTYFDLLTKFAKSQNNELRLFSCDCIANMHYTGVLKNTEFTKLNVLPFVIHLLSSDKNSRIKSPVVLSKLVKNSTELQKASCDGEALSKLTLNIKQMCENNESDYDPLTKADRELLLLNSLNSIADLSANLENCRKQVVESKALPYIIQAMQSHNKYIRNAACLCAKSLSRSVKNLRTKLIEEDIAAPLFKLLEDESVDVMISASATLCNLVLDFSPIKKSFIEYQGMETLVKLLVHSDSRIRLNAVWGLKNLLFQAGSDVKQSVLQSVGADLVLKLLEDTDENIQIQAVSLLRNLTCGVENDIDSLFRYFDKKTIVQIIEQGLENENQAIVIQIVYLIVNIATGSSKHKDSIMNSQLILKNIKELLSSENTEIRLAALWSIINLTWIDSDKKAGEKRVKKLKSLNFELEIRRLSNDNCLDVRDRSLTALDHFNLDKNSQ